jgi:hypothetical protein
MTSRRTLHLAMTALLGAVSLIVALVAATPASAHTVSGTEHITGLSTSVNGATTIIARGPIHARGRDVVVNAHRDRFVFPKGALIVRHAAVRQHDTFDKATCYGTHTETGNYRVLGGTGAYAHASGHGRYRVLVQFVGCSQANPPKIFMFQLNAAGPLSF